MVDYNSISIQLTELIRRLLNFITRNQLLISLYYLICLFKRLAGRGWVMVYVFLHAKPRHR